MIRRSGQAQSYQTFIVVHCISAPFERPFDCGKVSRRKRSHSLHLEYMHWILDVCMVTGFSLQICTTPNIYSVVPLLGGLRNKIVRTGTISGSYAILRGPRRVLDTRSYDTRSDVHRGSTKKKEYTQGHFCLFLPMVNQNMSASHRFRRRYEWYVQVPDDRAKSYS